MVAVAQSAERLVVVQEVAGSNPVSHPTMADHPLPLPLPRQQTTLPP